MGRFLTIQAIGGGQVPGFVPPLDMIHAINRFNMPQVLGGARTSANQRVFNNRRAFMAGDFDELVLTIWNRLTAQNTTNASEAAGVAFTGAWHIEVAGVPKVITFNGATSAAVAAGQIGLRADPINDSNAPGLLTQMAAGAPIFIGEERTYAVGAQPAFYSANVVHSIPGDTAFFGPATAPSKIGVAAPATTAGGYTASYAIFGGTAILGRPKRKTPCIAVPGASLENYIADQLGDGVDGKGGYVMRAAAKSPILATANLAVSGDSWRGFSIDSTMRADTMKYANIIVYGYAGNDFTNGETASATITRAKAGIVLAQAASLGAKILVMRPMTKVDADGVTPKAGFTAWRAEYDAAMRADTRIIYVESVVAAIEASDGVPKAGYMSADGVHLTPLGHGVAADAFRAVIDAIAAMQ